MLVGDGFSRMGVLGCEEGITECSECRSAGEDGRMWSPAVLECMMEKVHAPEGVRGDLGRQG